jgi:hypothetical protein
MSGRNQTGHFSTNPIQNPSWLSATDCRFNGCLGFKSFLAHQFVNGSTNHLPTGSAPRSQFTWVYPTVFPVTGCGPNIGFTLTYGDKQGSVPNNSFSALGTNGSGYVSFASNFNDFTSNTLKVPLNAWTLIGFTYSGGTSITLYKNNVSQLGTLSQKLNTTTTIHQFAIGDLAGNAGCNFVGRIDDARIYNYSLSSSQVNYLFSYYPVQYPTFNPPDFRPSVGLVGYWNFNEAQGTTAYDYSGSLRRYRRKDSSKPGWPPLSDH